MRNLKDYLIKLTLLVMLFISLSISVSIFPLSNESKSLVLSSSLRISKSYSISDTTPPLITSPADVTYVVGSTENIISWYIADSNPKNYSILMNYQSIPLELSNEWTQNMTVDMNVDGLPIGIHLYTIIVEDTWGNQNEDSVVVTVLESTNVVTFTLSTTTLIDLPKLIDSLSSLGINIAIIIIIMWILINVNRYLKRRSLSSKLPPIDPLKLELLNDDEI